MQNVAEDAEVETIDFKNIHVAPPRLERWLPYAPSLYGFLVDAGRNFVSWSVRTLWKWTKSVTLLLVDIACILAMVALSPFSKRPIDQWRRLKRWSFAITALSIAIIGIQLRNDGSFAITAASVTLTLVFVTFAKVATKQITAIDSQR